jgi:hypothetical protein
MKKKNKEETKLNASETLTMMNKNTTKFKQGNEDYRFL